MNDFSMKDLLAFLIFLAIMVVPAIIMTWKRKPKPVDGYLLTANRWYKIKERYDEHYYNIRPKKNVVLCKNKYVAFELIERNVGPNE